MFVYIYMYICVCVCVDSPLRAWSALRENLEIKYVIGLRLLSCLLQTRTTYVFAQASIIHGPSMCVCVCMLCVLNGVACVCKRARERAIGCPLAEAL